jgi:RNA polymerase sigma factor (sigma-70 family)
MSDIRDAYLAYRVFRSKDAQAFEALFDLHAPKVRGFLRSKLPRLEDADDLTAEAFLRAWEYMSASEVDHPLALLFRIARNLVADFYRKQKETVDISAAAHISTGHDLASATADQEEVAELKRKINLLKPEFAEVLLLHYELEMKPRDIASVLGKTPNSVRILLFKAKRALQAIL